MKNNKQNTNGFIARSAINKSMILCTNNEFHHESNVGAAVVGGWGAKVFKTEKGAINARGRQNIAVRVVNGVEVN
jgi:hypothetical protein